MILKHILLIIYFIINIIPTNLYSSSWFSNIFKKQEHEDIKKKEYPVSLDTSLKISNVNGNIKITGTDRGAITVTGKKSGSKEEISSTQVNIQQKDTDFIIDINSKNRIPSNVDLEITIPKNISIKLIELKNGNLNIEKVKGTIEKVVMESGEINFDNIEAPLQSINLDKGNIVLNNIKNNINLVILKNGNLEINNSTRSIRATVDRGLVNIKQNQFDENSAIFIDGSRVNVHITLPKKLNADIKANTKFGKITSKYPITFQTITMKIDEESWRNLKKNIEGIIGNGGGSVTIEVVERGNITLDTF